ncbi:hypothetical protein DW1_0981 [Proteiniborus sp. DW1]|uniref:ABC transporter substrate-binding protein n=1 Tax=Proteiniborus sp. DW1 TaxID=1889883 RepID=UPI00092E06C9|nr:ABC transporter substrate-binding protein [Proteiniborus sp. DW1]SCG82588.1 hypothetical protein DW1_0981 [Proteiniborus sp. DW1]
MREQKNRVIILSVILIAIIVTGILLTKNNEGKESSIKSNEELKTEINENPDVTTDAFYYVEDFLGEEEYRQGFNRLFRYHDQVVKFAGDDKVYLEELKSKENIYELPYEDMELSEWYICQNTFWHIRYDKESNAVIVSSFDSEGNEKDRITLKDFKGYIDDYGVYVKSMKITNDYIYILTYDDEPIFQIFDKKGELKNSYRDIVSYDADNNGRLIYSNTTGFYMIDSETGDELFANSNYNVNPIRFSEDGNYIYGFGSVVPDPRMINAFDANNGEFIREIFDFRKYATYLLDDYIVHDFIVGKDEEIYLSLIPKDFEMQDLASSFSYYLYTKREGERPKRETTVILTAPYRYDFLEEAIKLYEFKYPEEHIEYNYAYNTYEAFLENTKEYGAKLALDIISGDVGDIVQTGGAGIEYQDLLRTDAFMDLTDLIVKDKNYQYLNKSVLNGIKINNSIQALPITYIFYQYELNEELEKELGLNIDFNNISWSEILDLVKVIEEKAPDRHLFTHPIEEKTPWDILGYYLIIVNMPDLVNLETKEIDLNQQWFKDLLIKFKEYSKSKNFLLIVEPDLVDRLQGSLLTRVDIGYRFYSDVLANFVRYNEKYKSRMIPSFTGEKNENRIGHSKRMFSINNRSERKENAWKFLSFLLTEDIQFLVSEERSGTPISQKGVERMIEYDAWMHDRSGDEDNVDKFNKSTIENSQKINYLYDMGYIRQDLIDAIKLYMDDEMTLDEALKKAEESIMIRLNE